MAVGFTQLLTEVSISKCFWGVECGRCLRLITSPPSVSRLSEKCGILDIPKPYGSTRPLTGIASQFFFYFVVPAFILRPVPFSYADVFFFLNKAIPVTGRGGL
jgi:hypothetical protein